MSDDDRQGSRQIEFRLVADSLQATTRGPVEPRLRLTNESTEVWSHTGAWCGTGSLFDLETDQALPAAAICVTSQALTYKLEPGDVVDIPVLLPANQQRDLRPGPYRLRVSFKDAVYDLQLEGVLTITGTVPP